MREEKYPSIIILLLLSLSYQGKNNDLANDAKDTFLVGRTTTPTIRLDCIAPNPPYPSYHSPIDTILYTANCCGIKL
jgi:hypothetical protein